MFDSLREELEQINLFTEESELDYADTNELPNDDASDDSSINNPDGIDEDDEELEDDIVDDVENGKIEDDILEDDEEDLDDLLESFDEDDEYLDSYLECGMSGCSSLDKHRDFIDQGNGNFRKFNRVFLDKNVNEDCDNDDCCDDDLLATRCTPKNSDYIKAAKFKQMLSGDRVNPYDDFDDFDSDDNIEDDEFDTMGNVDDEVAIDESIAMFLDYYNSL